MEDRSILDREGPPPTLGIQLGDVYLHPDRLIVLLHGGFWRPEFDRIHLRPFAAALRDAGYEVITLNYRRIPGDPDATVNDVRSGLEELGPGVTVIGHSAGGHLALWAAATLGLKAIALAPVTDLREAQRLDLDKGAVGDFLGVPAESRPDLDPILLPSSGAVLIHGDRDTVVPVGLSHAYVAAHPSSRLVELAGTAHFELIDPLSDAWPIVIQELQRLLA
jgi:acetyl esterase/lipase